MPERTRPTRSTSRRLSPQPPTTRTAKQTAPVASQRSQRRNLRGARSQSREPESMPVISQPAPRAARRGSRQASVESTMSADNRVDRPTRLSKRKQGTIVVEELAPVEEIVEAILPIVEIPSTNAPPTTEILGRTSIGAISDMSGTTAISSFTSADAADIDRDMLIDSLVDVEHAAERFIQHIAPSEASPQNLETIIQDLNNPDSRRRRLFLSKSSVLLTHLEYFPDAGQDFFRPHVVLKALLGDSSLEISGSSPKRPDEILYKANLTILGKRLMPLERDKAETYDFTKRLDATFPSPFLSSVVSSDESASSALVGSTHLRWETFELALDLRTQLTFLVLFHEQNNENFNPMDILDEVFLIDTSESQETDSQEVIMRGWQSIGMGLGGTLPDDMAESVMERYNQIREFFQNADVDFEGFGTQYPWSRVLVKALEWIRLRNEELNNLIKQRGGMGTITDALKHIIISVEDVNSLEKPSGKQKADKTSTRPIKKAKSRRRKSEEQGKASANMLKAYNASRAQFDQTQGTIARAPQSAQDIGERETLVHDTEDNWQMIDEGQDSENVVEEIQSSHPTGSYQDAFAAIKDQNRIHKENIRQPSSQSGGDRSTKRFIDRQENAQRVEWDELDDTQRPPRAPAQISHGRKRTHSHVEDSSDDESDEDAFQEDRRQFDKSRRQHTKQKRSKYATQVEEQHEQAEPQTQVDRTNAEDKVNDEMAQDMPDAPVEEDNSDGDDHDIYNRAVQVSTQKTALSNKPRKGREAWTSEEEKALLRCLKKFGCKWSLIEKEKIFENRRDQGALKDKARNMKFNCLASDTVVPAFFEGVTLGKSYEERLRKKGVVGF